MTSLAELKQIPLKSPARELSVPLGRVAEITRRLGPSEINHANLVPVEDVYVDAQGRDVGGLSADVRKAIAKIDWPRGYRAEVRGEIREMESAVESLKGGFLLAAALVYLILVVQFESFKIPSIVMATVPVGLVGIALTLALTRTYFSIQAAIGAIFMIGIAVGQRRALDRIHLAPDARASRRA